MTTITLRSVKGSALSATEADNNFSNLNNDKVELTDLSVGANASASGTGGVAYNNTTGVFTYTPPTASGLGAITSVSDDTTPALGGNLDVGSNGILTTTTNGDISITANGTGSVVLTGTTVELGQPTITNPLGAVKLVPTSSSVDLVTDSIQLGASVSSTEVLLAVGNSSAADLKIRAGSTGKIIMDDDVVVSGGDLDMTTKNITTTTTNGNINIVNNGTGVTYIDGGNGIQIASGYVTSPANTNLTLVANGTGVISLNSNLSATQPATFTDTVDFNNAVTVSGALSMGSTGYIVRHRESIYEAGGGSGVSGTYNPDASNAPIHYLPLVGNITINGFTNGNPGETITMLIDSATVAGTYTLTLGAGILTPGGTADLTPSGYDLLTITLVDDVAGLYIATIVNDFQ